MAMSNVLGQKRIAKLLTGMIEHQRVSHAYIFAGPKGVGKDKMALEFAKALNCISTQADACDSCHNCRRIEHHNHQDVIWIEPDGKSIKIEQIRQLQKSFQYKLVDSKYKVLIIKQAEFMTLQAANSLLKFLEEPISPLVAILLVESQHQLISTIRSRCQIITFPYLDQQSIVQEMKQKGYREVEILLASNLTVDIEEVKNILDSDEFAQMKNIMVQWNEEIYSEDYRALLTVNDKIVKNDYIKQHLSQFLDLLILWYRDILNVKLNRNAFLVYRDYENILIKQGMQLTEERLIDQIEKIFFAKKQIAANVNLQLALEHLVLSIWEG
ncbi:DNA polymerase III subunit delta' [Vulcanibacillus modesticaldus]|uniref:DNA polymerase III subunit delta' n=1 Tax=Vulcanibacillus modesticaldus TaxID=337097 RepID=A0A1D2YXD6_9BACI|nr:DNA polymerase III subunit delta' [Vulcanibacillus modesticaldus]OEG00277.1 DNA polymerase III subunit delta' [Vulcanibacillus modesticaldus]